MIAAGPKSVRCFGKQHRRDCRSYPGHRLNYCGISDHIFIVLAHRLRHCLEQRVNSVTGVLALRMTLAQLRQQQERVLAHRFHRSWSQLQRRGLQERVNLLGRPAPDAPLRQQCLYPTQR